MEVREGGGGGCKNQARKMSENNTPKVADQLAVVDFLQRAHHGQLFDFAPMVLHMLQVVVAVELGG